MTFLFTDVVRSTALLSNLDRSRYADLIDVQRTAVEHAIAHANGTVVDRAGDGILAAFETAGDALAAAAAAQRTLAADPDTASLVSVRMGIDSGDVLLRGETYVGLALHRGARICALAAGGSVILSATARALVGTQLPDAVELRDLGAVALTGFPEPTQLFQAVLADLPGTAARPPLPRGRATQLLDRDAELAVLDERIRAAAVGAGAVIAIEGPAGIGKTTLLDAARDSAAGMTALAARATELETGYPLGVVRHLLEHAATTAGDAAFAGAAAAARPIFGGASTGSVGDGFAILHALYWLTVNLAEARPLLLTVDDVQWADGPSLRFLAYLAPRIADLPIALVLSRRTGERAADETALQIVLSDPTTTLVTPGGLAESAVEELLRRTLSESPHPEFLRACRDATGANPLLVRELAAALAAAGVSPTADAIESIPELGPGAVSRFVLRRLGRLDAQARTLAESVAVLGDGCALAVAAGHSDLAPAVAAEAAGSLARADLLVAGLPLRFVHPLVRQAVYLGLEPVQLGHAHARAAAVLDRTRDPIRVGLHLLHAPPGTPAAVDALTDAARAAERDGAADSAATFLRRLLDEDLSPAQRVETLVALGSAELRFDPAAAAVDLAAAVRERSRPDEAVLLLARALYVAGRHRESIAVLRTALAALDDPDDDLVYRLQAELIGPLSEIRDTRAIGELLERVRVRPLHGDGIGRRMLSAQAASTLDMPLPREEYVRLAAEAVSDDVLLEDETSDIYVWATVCLAAADDWTTARAALDRAVDYGRRRGSLHLLSAALRLRAHLHRDLGDLASAEVDARAGLAALELRPLPMSIRYLGAMLAAVLVDRGRSDEAEAVLEGLPPGETPEAAVVIYARVSVALARGRPADALVALAPLDEEPGSERAVVPRLWLLLRVQALCALDRAAEAAPLAAVEVRRARDWGAPSLLGRTLRIAALAAEDEAQLALLQEAASALAESPARLERARVLGALGASTRRMGDRAEARDVLRHALELAHVCGAAALEGEIQAELAAAGARPRRARLSGLESLTPSELRVADLAAVGRTNREIAEELFVTMKTIEMHLASCYRKLGIASRNQLPRVMATQAQG